VEPGEYERIHRLETTHFWYRGLHALVLGALRRHPPETGRRPPRILDAGCGTGGLTRRLAACGPVVGLDLSPVALELAATPRGLSLVRGDVASLPFRDAAFDAVVAADVLYHRAVTDDRAALAELARVCRPGGVVVLNLPAHDWLRGAHDAQVHTARRYGRRRVRGLAAAAGLAVERLAWFNCALFPLALARRVASPREARSDVWALPAALNAALAAWMRVEAAAAVAGVLPWGLSLLAVLRRRLVHEALDATAAHR
jgi:SAM-dependent methyltransferase